jgi:Protein of unknown function (DUF732)
MKLRYGTLAPAALAAGIAWAPLAQADMSSYLAYLQNHGVLSYDPNGNQGVQECAALHQGKSELFLMGQLIQAYGWGKAQAEDVVGGAHRYLCPDA